MSKVEYWIHCPNCGNQKIDWVRQIAPSGHKEIYRCDSCILEEETCNCGCGLTWRRDDWERANKKVKGNIDAGLEERWGVSKEQKEFDEGFNKYLNENHPVRPW